MAGTQYRPVPPDQRIRELRKTFGALQKEAPSPERAERLASFTRAAHADRQLNMAMHTAQLCLADDPQDPALLVAAYVEGVPAGEDLLRALSDLDDLARYIGRDDVRGIARERIRAEAASWVAAGGGVERRHRLRVLATLFDRTFADEIGDAVGVTG